MDLRQLAALAAVADHHSFSAAARALHTVQSNVSTHVARLEQELGDPLVDRTTGTPDRGRRAGGRPGPPHRSRARGARGRRGVRRRRGLGHRPPRDDRHRRPAGWPPPCSSGMAADLPKVHVVVVDATTTSLLPQLAAGRLDLAVVNLPVHDPDVRTEPLFDEDHVLVVPRGHPLAEHGRHDAGRTGPPPAAARAARAPASATTSTPTPPAPASQPHPGGRGRRHAPAGHASPSRASAPPSCRPAPSPDGAPLGPACRRRRLGRRPLDGDGSAVALRRSISGLRPRRVGMAVSTRTHLSAPAVAVQDLLVQVLGAQVPPGSGVRLEPGGTIAPRGSPQRRGEDQT